MKKKKMSFLEKLQESWLIILLTIFAVGLFSGAVRKWDAIEDNTKSVETLENNYQTIIKKLEGIRKDIEWLKEKNGFKKRR